MDRKYLVRQSDLIPEKILKTPITVIGAGAIGSWTTLALAKMGFSDITVYDFDVIDEANMNCQFFPLKDIGKKKVDALSALVLNFTGLKITTHDKYCGGSHHGIVITAVDSLDVRKLIWGQHKTSMKTKFLIDPRMGALDAMLYTVKISDPEDRKSYDNTFQAKAAHVRCTAKATMFTANILSGWVCKAVVDALMKPDDYLARATWDIDGNDVKLYSKKWKPPEMPKQTLKVDTETRGFADWSNIATQYIPPRGQEESRMLRDPVMPRVTVNAAEPDESPEWI